MGKLIRILLNWFVPPPIPIPPQMKDYLRILRRRRSSDTHYWSVYYTVTHGYSSCETGKISVYVDDQTVYPTSPVQLEKWLNLLDEGLKPPAEARKPEK